MTKQPTALVVEDTPVHGTLAEMTLGEVGFHVVWVRTLLEGWRWASDRLDAQLPASPSLILLDMKLPDPDHPRLEGAVLATWLSDEMQAGRLHPAHIIAISSELTPQREWSALAAGCSLVLAKPLTPLKAQLLRDLFAEPPPPPSPEVAVQAFRQGQRDVLDLIVRASQTAVRLWSAGEVRVLVGTLTAAVHLLPSDRDLGTALIAELGGVTALRLRLRTLLPRLSAEQSRLLTLLLQDVTQQQIAGRFGMGRRALERQIELLFGEIAVLLSSTK